MSSATPQIVSRASEAEFAEFLATEAGFLEGLCSFEDRPLTLEHYQRNFLDFTGSDGRKPRFRIVNKSRQVGFSFLVAAESLARCHLASGYRAVHVSYNLADAKEKILAARALYEELPLRYQKRLAVDSKTELAFEPRGSKTGHRSRIISNPARPPRGRNGDVYLDELGHVGNDAEIYAGATALILRSKGQLTITSTPLGKRGKFWEIFREEVRPYRRFQRFFVPWWFCEFFCVDVAAAAIEAPGLSSAERIERFGTEDMQAQFESLPLEDFRQEFEGDFVDEAFSFYPYELILPCTDPEMEVAELAEDLPPPRADSRLVGGVDIGRVKDRTVISIFEERGESGAPSFEARYIRSLHNVPFREQEEEIRRILAAVPLARLSIDRTGLGRNLAENLGRDWPQVEEFDFTNQSKERLATDFKILLQQRRVVLPRRRELVSDIHAIRRHVTPSGNVIFSAERTAAGHADMFWSVALACQIEKGATGRRVRARVIG